MIIRPQLALTVALGLASGVIGSALGGLVFREDSQKRPPELERNPVVQLESARDLSFEDWVRSEHSKRLARLEERVMEKEGSTEEEAPVEEALRPPTPLSIEESREHTLADWYDRLDQHGREPVDRAWSTQVEPQLQKEVGELARENNFKLLETSCRSHTCSATLEWKDYTQAADGYAEVLHYPYSNGCLREIILPEPEERGKPYQATVLYDCTESRKGS